MRECGAVSFDGSGAPLETVKAVAIDEGEGGIDSQLFTRENFGCVLFEARTK